MTTESLTSVACIIIGAFLGHYFALKKERKIQYSKGQFQLYLHILESLYDLKGRGQQLWIHNNPEKLSEFITQLEKTKRSIIIGSVLIEEDHFSKLKEILGKFYTFQFGKITLQQLHAKRKSIDEINIEEIEYTTKKTKEQRKNMNHLWKTS